MELARKMMAESVTQDVPWPKARRAYHAMETDSGETIWIETPLWAHRWQRLVIMLALVSKHAATGCLLQHLEVMRDRHEKEAYERWQRLTQRIGPPGCKSLAKAKPLREVPMPMAKGKALSRSTTEKWKLEPETCAHHSNDMSAPRGGRGGLKWLTCLKCGSRWERIETVSTEPPPLAPMPGTASRSSGSQVVPQNSQGRPSDESSVDEGFVVTSEPMKIGQIEPICVEEQLELMYASLLSQQLTPVEALERIRNLPMTESDKQTFFTFMAKKVAR